MPGEDPQEKYPGIGLRCLPGKSLSQIVDVDYFLPGCPPAVVLIEKLIPILEGMLEGVVPPKGTVIASDKTLCDECSLEKIN